LARVVKISVSVGNFSAADTAFRPPVLLSYSAHKHICYTALHPQVAPCGDLAIVDSLWRE